MNDNRKNFNEAPISNVNGPLTFGDNSNNVTNNYYSSAEYQTLKIKLNELNIKFEKLQEQKRNHPDVRYFSEESIETDYERTQTRKELDDHINGMKKIVEEYQHFPEKSTERLRSAKQYLEIGKLDGARATFDAKEMDQELNALLDQKKRLSSSTKENAVKLKDNSDEFLIKAYLTSLDFTLPDRFEKTKKYFERSLVADRNGRNLSAFGSFLLNHNEVTDAEPLFIEALDYYKGIVNEDPQTISPILAEGHKDLGHLYFRLGNDSKALIAYNDALAYYDKLPETYKVDRVRVLSAKAGVLARMGKIGPAHDVFKEVFEAYKDLPKTLKSDVASTLNDYGITLAITGNVDEAKSVFNTIIKLRRDLGGSEPENCLALAAALDSLAYLKAQRNLKDTEKDYSKSLEEAEKDYNESIEIIRKLARKNPNAYLPELARIAVNLSAFYRRDKPDAEKSIALASEAIRSATPFIGKLQIADDVIRIAKEVLKD